MYINLLWNRNTNKNINLKKNVLFSHFRNRLENTLRFYIPVENVRYSYLFGSLEKNQRRLNISEYTIDLPSMSQALDNILATRILREQYKKKGKDKAKLHAATSAPKDFNLKNQDPKSSDKQDLQN